MLASPVRLWEFIRCPYCQSTGDHLLRGSGEHRVAWCQECFHVHFAPEPQPGDGYAAANDEEGEESGGA